MINCSGHGSSPEGKTSTNPKLLNLLLRFSEDFRNVCGDCSKRYRYVSEFCAFSTHLCPNCHIGTIQKKPACPEKSQKWSKISWSGCERRTLPALLVRNKQGKVSVPVLCPSGTEEWPRLGAMSMSMAGLWFSGLGALSPSCTASAFRPAALAPAAVPNCWLFIECPFVDG